MSLLAQNYYINKTKQNGVKQTELLQTENAMFQLGTGTYKVIKKSLYT
jgi:hypothetical protein